MTVPIDVPDLYRGAPFNIWVEDTVAGAYFRELWSDQAIQFRFLVAGGEDGVGYLTHQAFDREWPGVFGIVDRDFEQSNHLDWLLPAKQFRRFVIPRFELENYFLDPDRLAAIDLNNTRKTSQEIRQRISTRAAALVWWMACRSVIAALRRSALDDFPAHPANTTINDLSTAKLYVEGTGWFQDIPRRISDATSSLVDKLNHSHALYLQGLTLPDNHWAEFSGKELFSDAASFFYSSSDASRDVDLAKSIARAHRESNTIPQDFQELLQSITSRGQP